MDAKLSDMKPTNNPMNRILFALALIITPFTQPLAQSETPYFNVELVLFERMQSNAGNSEIWPAITDIPFQGDAIPIQYGSTEGYVLLPESSQRLTPEAYTLERSGQYKLLAHLRWRQPGLSKKHARPVKIQGNNLEGTVTVSLSRFLHVDFDMLLNRFVPQTGQYRSYPFKEHRKMRSDELHYVDHPLVGALIKIERYSPDGAVQAPQAEEAIDTNDAADSPPGEEQATD